MPTAMEVRQRTRDWVKRERSTSRERAASDSHPNLEIVHLGGFRVSDKAKGELAGGEIERPVTRFFWPLLEEGPTGEEPEPAPKHGPQLEQQPKPLRLKTPSKKAAHADHALKRSQSEAQIQRTRSKWKELPARPAELTSPVSLDHVVHVAQVMSPASSTIPSQASSPPPAPLPKLPRAPKRSESADGVIRLGVRSDGVMSPTASSERSSGRDSDKTDRSPRTRVPRHNAKERVWLHRNYKGEAPFLAAWGLSIKSETDRIEGQQILKDLMQAEEDESGSTLAKARPEGQRAEEEQSEETRPGSQSQSRSHSQSRNQSSAERHQRQESGASVTGAYLDDRLSRLARVDEVSTVSTNPGP